VTTQETSPPLSEMEESKLMHMVESSTNESGDAIKTSQFEAVANEDQTMHELKALMERPTLIETGTINGSDTNMDFQYNRAVWSSMSPNNVPGLITVLTFPDNIINNNPVVADKIKQFSYFKGDIKVDIKINKGPQVSGCLLVAYLPVVENLGLDFTNLTVQAITSYPYQILDYSTDTSLTMKVPYINQYDYVNFQQGNVLDNGGIFNGPTVYGAVLIFNLQTPLDGTADAKVSYSAFASFENMELSLPVATNTSTQGPNIYAQSGIYRRIPAHDVMTGNMDGEEISLSYTTQPLDNSKVKYEQGETTLKHILGRENIIGKINYSKDRNAGVNSYLGKVRCFPKRPEQFNQNGSWTVQRAPMQMGTFDYTCNLFERYTGTVEIGIRLLKTKFHYGRIAVVFDPFDRLAEESAGSQVLGSILSTNYSMIIDLNAEDGTEGSSSYYRIQVPYMNNVGYSAIASDVNKVGRTGVLYSPANAAVDYRRREVYNPHLRFYALTDLGFLAAASDVVPILLSIRAGPDFQLSIPTVKVANAEPSVAVSGKPYCQSGNLVLIPQQKDTSKVNNDTCNGEEITDLCTLAHRFTAPFLPTAKTPAYIGLAEEGTQSGIVSSAPGGITLSLHQNTPLGYPLSNVEAISNLFRYTYGGRSYKAMADERGSTIMARLLHAPMSIGDIGGSSSSFLAVAGVDSEEADGFYAVAPVTGVSRALNGQYVVESDINNFIEVSRPFYSNRKLISTRKPQKPGENAGSLSGIIAADEVLTQIVSFSPSKEKTISFNNAITRIRLGPHVFKGASFTAQEAGSQTVDLETRLMPYRDVRDPNQGTDDWKKGMKSTCAFRPAEVTYGYDASTAGTYDFKCAEINTSQVLEALCPGAGFTFLQAPPCVVFL